VTALERPPLKPGDVLAHYRIESAIGEGATGVVYRAHDLALDRTVGLKVLKPEVSRDERFVLRFVREARAAARVSHPNLAHIYFVGEQDGHRFFAMEFIEGRDLQARVDAEGALRFEEVLDIVIQVARGLRAAHRAGVVHRDVKPSNILLQDDGVARVTDFGLAKSLDADVHTTLADTIVGTPTYMSPEQCRSETADERADVYALGLTTWFLLAGRLPYEAKSLGQVIDDQLNKPLPPLSDSVPDVPVALDDILQRMCAKDPADRPPDMDTVIAALEACRPRPILPATLVGRGVAAVIDLLPVVGIAALVDFGVERGLGLGRLTDTWWGGLVLLVLFAAYHLGSEIRWGTTPGKWLLGVEVVTSRGTEPRARDLVPRFVLNYPVVLVDLVNLTGAVQIVDVVAFSLQAGAVVASAFTYLFARQRSLSDILTRTRITTLYRPEAPEPS